MNEDVIKPFPCKENNCNCSFFTEDHLAVHQQAKHRKLNLEIPKGSSTIFADQTPTPTRLLNNCEELRVFDDLQNINPFEEGFRRAVEDDGSLRTQNYAALSYQDTLHTPQILPQLESSVKLEDSKPLPVQIEPENYKDNILVTSKLKETHQIPLLPKPLMRATPLNVTKSAEIFQDKNNETVKDKLKNIILSNSVTNTDRKRKLETIPTIVIEASFVATSSLTSNDSDVIRIENGTMTKDTVSSKLSLPKEINRKRTKGDKSELSNLKVERNRAAARRYRTKMKIQSQTLQEKYEKSQKELSTVKKELNELKKELTELKALLLVHKDCSISKVSTVTSQQ